MISFRQVTFLNIIVEIVLRLELHRLEDENFCCLDHVDAPDMGGKIESDKSDLGIAFIIKTTYIPTPDIRQRSTLGKFRQV
jgi:hypothetical protein